MHKFYLGRNGGNSLSMNLGVIKLTTKEKVNSHQVIWISILEQFDQKEKCRHTKILSMCGTRYLVDMVWPSCIGHYSPPWL